jgi:hypothetical protein
MQNTSEHVQNSSADVKIILEDFNKIRYYAMD